MEKGVGENDGINHKPHIQLRTSLIKIPKSQNPFCPVLVSYLPLFEFWPFEFNTKIDSGYPLTLTLSPGGAREIIDFRAPWFLKGHECLFQISDFACPVK